MSVSAILIPFNLFTSVYIINDTLLRHDIYIIKCNEIEGNFLKSRFSEITYLLLELQTRPLKLAISPSNGSCLTNNWCSLQEKSSTNISLDIFKINVSECISRTQLLVKLKLSSSSHRPPFFFVREYNSITLPLSRSSNGSQKMVALRRFNG